LFSAPPGDLLNANPAELFEEKMKKRDREPLGAKVNLSNIFEIDFFGASG
jgi:hypothetical protein